MDDARIALLEANLPEVMQEQGLRILDCSLGAEFQGTDLEAIAEELALEHAGAELDERDYIEREARRILSRFGATQPSAEFLKTFIDEVETYVDYYRGRHREFFERAYLRKHKYWPIIRTTFEAKGIPVEQGYMALVESGFSPRARSHANARGVWQFIPSTGRRYGLRRTQDFADVAKSTEAASEYLLDLIGIFGSRSFLLATAAYNAGEGRIMRCLRGLDDPFGDRSFWAIRPCLARETREYVPRILAAAVIGSDPKRFGFDLPTETEMAERYDVVTIPEPTSLATIARQAGVTVADLRTANSDLSSRASTTPARNFPLYIPKGGGQALISELSATPEPRPSTTELPLAVEMGSITAERLSTGDTRAAPPRPVLEQNDGLRPAGPSITVRAKRGDTLQAIAQKHGVSIADLKRWNPFLRNRVLYRGDRLTVYSKTQAPTTGGTTYRVFAVHHRPFYTCLSTHRPDQGLRQAWQPLFDEFEVDIVFTGHNHVYERSNPIRGLEGGQGQLAPAGPFGVPQIRTPGVGTGSPSGTIYVVAAGVGAPLYSVSDECPTTNVAQSIRNYVIVDIEDRNLTFTVYDAMTDTQIDMFTYSK